MNRQQAVLRAVWLQDPLTFGVNMLGVDLWSMQVEILRALERSRRVAVKACNSSGKSRLAAVAALYWITKYAKEGATCITTSSSWPQVEKVIWHEIHALLLAAAQRGVRYPAALQTRLDMPGGGFALGMSTNDAVNFHGFHGRRVLIIKDESTGVDPAIHEAIDSIAAGGDVHQLDLGNPVTTSGPFNDLFAAPESIVTQFTIDAFRSPNFYVPDEKRYLTPTELCERGDADHDEGGFLDQNRRPYLITRRWTWEVYQRYGFDSSYWWSHVRGEFPPEGADTLIPGHWVRAASEIAWKPEVDVYAGLDVAGPGSDETSLTVRSGPLVLEEQSWNEPDSARTIGRILALLEPYRNRLVNVNVDAVMIGHHMCGALASHGFPVTPVNVGDPATIGFQRRFANLKAQLYWGLRQLFEASYRHLSEPEIEPGICGPINEVTRAQLASLRYGENERGQGTMETKREMKRRGISSPDRAESLMLAFALSAAERVQTPYRYSDGREKQPAGGKSRWKGKYGRAAVGRQKIGKEAA